MNNKKKHGNIYIGKCQISMISRKYSIFLGMQKYRETRITRFFPFFYLIVLYFPALYYHVCFLFIIFFFVRIFFPFFHFYLFIFLFFQLFFHCHYNKHIYITIVLLFVCLFLHFIYYLLILLLLLLFTFDCITKKQSWYYLVLHARPSFQTRTHAHRLREIAFFCAERAYFLHLIVLTQKKIDSVVDRHVNQFVVINS